MARKFWILKGIVKKLESIFGDCRGLKTFITAMKDISCSLRASTLLKIFSLDINCLSQVMDFFFTSSAILCG